jgi:L-serine dehydratase
MSLLDIIGPVMIGPSSSHTAGAVRIGLMARHIWGWDRPLPSAKLFLRGSFAATYWGHGTDRGLVAGLLKMDPDDLRIPNAFNEARARGLDFSFDSEDVDGAHPNSVRIVMSDGKESVEIVGASVGGGAVELQEVDGFKMAVPYDQPAVISMHRDVPGVVASITGEFYRRGLNLARMDLTRRSRGNLAVAVFILDGHVPADIARSLKEKVPACERVILLLSGSEQESAAQ